MHSETVTKSEITFSGGNTFNFDDLDKIEGILQQVPPAEDEEEKQPEETQQDQPPIEPEPMKLPEPLQVQPILTKSVVPERQFATKGGRRHAPPLPKLTVNVQQPWMGQQAQWAPQQPQHVKPKAVRKNKATLAQEEEYLPPGEERKRKRKRRQEERRALKGGFGAGLSVMKRTPARSARQMFTALSRPIAPKWIECCACGKWRKIPGDVQESQIPDPFVCANNIWDHCRQSCEIPQEEYVEEEPDQGGYAQHDDYAPRPRKRRRTYASRSSHSIEDILNDHSDPEYAMRRKQFYDELTVFLGRQPEVNQLCGKPVDLYHLYTETSNRGGYERVCDGKAWRQIFRTLPQFQDSHTSASYALKKMYRRNLLEYENHHLGQQA